MIRMSTPEVITMKEHRRVVAMEALNLLKNGQRVQESTNPLKAQYYEDRQAIKENFDGIDKELDGVNKNFDGIDKSLDIANKNFDMIIARMNQLEVRVKELEVFVDDIVRPAHKEPETEPKVEENLQKPRSSELRELHHSDDDGETRALVLQMEHARRKR